MQTPKELAEMIYEQWPGCPRMIFETLITARDNEILGETIAIIDQMITLNAMRSNIRVMEEVQMAQQHFITGYDVALQNLKTRLLAK